MDLALIDLYRVIGYPGYEPWKMEMGRVRDNACIAYSYYQEMVVLPQLVLVNIDAVDAPQGATDMMRKIQYERAMTSSTAFLEGIRKESQKWENNPAMKNIFRVLEKKVLEKDKLAQKFLKMALDKKRFLYTINNPSGKPVRKKFNVSGPNYTMVFPLTKPRTISDVFNGLSAKEAFSALIDG